jgi:hypothetical protein
MHWASLIVTKASTRALLEGFCFPLQDQELSSIGKVHGGEHELIELQALQIAASVTQYSNP